VNHAEAQVKMLLKTIICAAALLTYADACTVIALGKKATVDGSVMVSVGLYSQYYLRHF
jgi:hypothetical protein